MYVSLLTILLILNCTNFFLHSFGSYILLKLYPHSRHKAQQLYLVNLGISECLINLLESIRTVIILTQTEGKPSQVGRLTRYYILSIAFTGLSLVFYLIMIFITIDRLMIMILTYRYRRYWNERKARYLLIATWLFGAATSSTVALLYHTSDTHWESFFFKYIYPTIEILFILIALLTYSFIFHSYRKKRRLADQHPSTKRSSVRPRRVSVITGSYNTHHRKNNSFIKRKGKEKDLQENINNSVFYIPVLLITSFLLFMIIPDMVYLFVGIINKNTSDILSICCWLSYGTSNFLDAWIYIYFQHDVRNFITSTFMPRKRKVATVATVHSNSAVRKLTNNQQQSSGLYATSKSRQFKYEN